MRMPTANICFLGAIALGASAGLLDVRGHAPVLQLQLRGGGGLRGESRASAPLARTEPRRQAANGNGSISPRVCVCVCV